MPTRSARSAISAVLHDDASPFEVLPVDLAVGERVPAVPRNLEADPGDRILVATAEVHGPSIVSADGKIPSMTDCPVVW